MDKPARTTLGKQLFLNASSSTDLGKTSLGYTCSDGLWFLLQLRSKDAAHYWWLHLLLSRFSPSQNQPFPVAPGEEKHCCSLAPSPLMLFCIFPGFPLETIDRSCPPHTARRSIGSIVIRGMPAATFLTGIRHPPPLPLVRLLKQRILQDLNLPQPERTDVP